MINPLTYPNIRQIFNSIVYNTTFLKPLFLVRILKFSRCLRLQNFLDKIALSGIV